MEKGVDNELITFVGYKQLWTAVQPTANCEEIQKVPHISKLADDDIKKVGFGVNNCKVLQMAHLNMRIFSKLAAIKWKKHLGGTVGSSSMTNSRNY